MGAWGTGIYDNDDAADILGDYKIILGYKIAPEEAYKIIKDTYYDDFKDTDTEDAYWLTIALYQWKNGILMEEVKENALKCIEDERYLEIWEECGEKQYNKRKAVLNDLKNKLLYEINPPREKFPKCPLMYRTKTPYEVGDLLVCHIIGDKDIYAGISKSERWKQTLDMLRNQYVLFRVVHVYKSPVTELIPELDYTSSAAVMLYDWHGYELPSEEVISKLEFRPIVHIYGEEIKQIVSAVVLENFEKKSNKYCTLSKIANDSMFCENKPTFYEKYPGAPSVEHVRFFNDVINTFTMQEGDKTEWYFKK